jgi:hypothetical protein
MNCHNIIFTKPLGLSSNLANLLILNDYCIKNNFNLIFFIAENHLEILKKLDTIAQFIVVDGAYQQLILKGNYLKLGPLIFAIKLKSLIKNHFLKELDLSDTYFYDADWIQSERRPARKFIKNIPLDKTNILVYNTYDSVELLNISPIKIAIGDDPNILFNETDDNILSFNLIDIHKDKKITCAFWDYIIENKLKQYPTARLFFVSGNYETLQRFTVKYGAINKLDKLSYETRPRSCRTNYSKTIGSPNNIYYDMLNCSFTNFQSFDSVLYEFPEVRNIFSTAELVQTTLPPMFDVLINYFKNNNTIIR